MDTPNTASLYGSREFPRSPEIPKKDIDASDMPEDEIENAASRCFNNIREIWSAELEPGDKVEKACVVILEAAGVLPDQDMKITMAKKHICLSQQVHHSPHRAGQDRLDEVSTERSGLDRVRHRILYALQRASEVRAQIEPRGLWPSNTESIVARLVELAPSDMSDFIKEVSARLMLTSQQLHNSKGIAHG